MRATATICTDVNVLRNRITVNDKELAVLLGCGLATARRIAENANAVVFDGKRRLTLVSKLTAYLETVSS